MAICEQMEEDASELPFFRRIARTWRDRQNRRNGKWRHQLGGQHQGTNGKSGPAGAADAASAVAASHDHSGAGPGPCAAGKKTCTPVRANGCDEKASHLVDGGDADLEDTTDAAVAAAAAGAVAGGSLLHGSSVHSELSQDLELTGLNASFPSTADGFEDFDDRYAMLMPRMFAQHGPLALAANGPLSVQAAAAAAAASAPACAGAHSMIVEGIGPACANTAGAGVGGPGTTAAGMAVAPAGGVQSLVAPPPCGALGAVAPSASPCGNICSTLGDGGLNGSCTPPRTAGGGGAGSPLITPSLMDPRASVATTATTAGCGSSFFGSSVSGSVLELRASGANLGAAAAGDCMVSGNAASRSCTPPNVAGTAHCSAANLPCSAPAAMGSSAAGALAPPVEHWQAVGNGVHPAAGAGLNGYHAMYCVGPPPWQPGGQAYPPGAPAWGWTPPAQVDAPQPEFDLNASPEVLDALAQQARAAAAQFQRLAESAEEAARAARRDGGRASNGSAGTASGGCNGAGINSAAMAQAQALLNSTWYEAIAPFGRRGPVFATSTSQEGVATHGRTLSGHADPSVQLQQQAQQQWWLPDRRPSAPSGWPQEADGGASPADLASPGDSDDGDALDELSPQLRHSSPATAGDSASGSSSPTTLVLRNLPSGCSRAELLELLDSHGFNGKYDFIYYPVDFSRLSHLGYAFVNMVAHEDAKALREHFQGYSAWPQPLQPGQQMCEVAWAEPLQGYAAHVRRYRNSPVMHDSVPDEYKPMIFDGGVRQAFPAPTRRIRAPRVKHGARPGSWVSRSMANAAAQGSVAAVKQGAGGTPACSSPNHASPKGDRKGAASTTTAGASGAGGEGG